jgi:SAM-dependent methyltransferase
MTDQPQFDPAQYKKTTTQQWDAAAKAWDDWGPTLHDWLGPVTELMFDLANLRPGSHVLDVAAGAGEQTVQAAGRVGPTGRVLATDISPRILERAAANARRAGLSNVECKVLEGENLDVASGAFDAVRGAASDAERARPGEQGRGMGGDRGEAAHVRDSRGIRRSVRDDRRGRERLDLATPRGRRAGTMLIFAIIPASSWPQDVAVVAEVTHDGEGCATTREETHFGGLVQDVGMRGHSTTLSSGNFAVVPGQSITVVYTSAPTWEWFLD